MGQCDNKNREKHQIRELGHLWRTKAHLIRLTSSRVCASHIVTDTKPTKMSTTESEKKLEARLRTEIEKRGGVALKLLSQFHRGLPDRLVLLPYGITYFVEMKTTGERPTLLQQHAHKMLRNLGQHVVIVDTSEKLASFLQLIDVEILETRNARGI